MDRSQMIQVMGRDGILGWMDPKEQTDEQAEFFIRLSNGQAILVPADMLAKQDDGSYYLPMSRSQFVSQTAAVDAGEEGTSPDTLMVIPVMVEKAHVGTERITRRIRVRKRVTRREETIDMPGYREEVFVERVPVDQIVETAPGVRKEGDTTIIPILEEELIVQKRLRVVEEVRVTLKQIPNAPQTVTLRSEEVDIERLEGEQGKERLIQAEKE